ncbi:response regulator transcription factor [Stakelama sp. CBK3Z-3]|uniref:Response regulator transcription factor n=1 Tax=Stakelama flava TaxID=2860338 RepID=A0ABS6XK13_9SPHN|nr:response regulator transcription factor [Stakelama flava]MBW4330548.1 response regulator transcription factor [Stakelama flava]
MNDFTSSPVDGPNGAALLIVDDDRAIRDLLGRSLTGHGYRVTTAANTREMEEVLREGGIDLILLDIMMPGEDGLSACRRIIGSDGPPVVFLSALGEEDDRITGLETGASHYLPKPCSAREVLATVRAALRQRGQVEPSQRKAFRFGSGWLIDFTSHELVDPKGVLVDLTDGEFAVLRAFVERPRRVLPRETLLEAARGPDSESFDRAIDVQVSRLRRKLNAEGDIIRTIRNEGYMFAPQVSRA